MGESEKANKQNFHGALRSPPSCSINLLLLEMLTKMANNNLNFYYQNVRGLRTKCLDLRLNILTNDFDVIVLTESWLHSGIFDGELCDDRYDVFRADRDLRFSDKSTGGGVLILTRRTLGAVHRDLGVCNPTEILWITIPASTCASNFDLHICAAYIPPESRQMPSNINFIRQKITSVIELCPNDHFLIIGDFNLPSICWNTDGYTTLKRGSTEVQDASIQLIEALTFHGLKQFNTLKNYAGNTLDLAFSNLPLNINPASAPLLKEDRAHPSFCGVVLDLNIIPLRENTTPRRNFRKADFDCINSYLLEQDWRSLLCAGTIDEATDSLYNILDTCVRSYVPLSSTGKRSYPKWYTSALIKIIKEKTKAHTRWKKFGNRLDYDEFKLLRARERRVQRECFNRFKSSCESNIKKHPKTFWTFVKATRGGSGYPKKMCLDGAEYTEGKDICNAFNSFFQSVFGVPSSNSTPAHTEQTCTDVVSNVQINTSTVEVMLKTLDTNKGAGSDGLPSLFWSRCAKSLALPLTLIFNRSLREGIFPYIWKSALIVPVHKKGSRTDIKNYRAISILNTAAKIFERVVYDVIYTTLARSIPEQQHGFLRKRSTTSNLASFSSFVLENMDHGGQVDVIYTDFEKAFDRVDHVILLNKLQILGIHGDLLRWTESYLTNRSQAVVIGGYRSNYVNVPTGVPQGSHLGPLFYNAYLYDIGSCMEHTGYLMYADDKKIFLKIDTVHDCLLIQRDLNRLLEYYRKNKITINAGKCECISFTRKPKPIQHKYYFEGVEISRKQCVRDLGVYFDHKMTLSEHIDYITTKAYKNLGFVLRICKPFSDIDAIKMVYFAYVRSVLEYASSIWSPQYKVYKNRIERIQKIFSKHLNYLLHNSFVTYTDSCTEHNLLSLEKRRVVLDMALLYDIINSNIDCPNLVSKVTFRTPKYRTRNTTLLDTPRHHTKYHRNSVLSRLAFTYNKEFGHIDIFGKSKITFKKDIIKAIKNLTLT